MITWQGVALGSVVGFMAWWAAWIIWVCRGAGKGAKVQADFNRELMLHWQKQNMHNSMIELLFARVVDCLEAQEARKVPPGSGV